MDDEPPTAMVMSSSSAAAAAVSRQTRRIAAETRLDIMYSYELGGRGVESYLRYGIIQDIFVVILYDTTSDEKEPFSNISQSLKVP